MDAEFTDKNTVTFSDDEIRGILCRHFRNWGYTDGYRNLEMFCDRYHYGWTVYTLGRYLGSVSPMFVSEILAKQLSDSFGTLGDLQFEYLEAEDKYSPLLRISWVAK